MRRPAARAARGMLVTALAAALWVPASTAEAAKPKKPAPAAPPSGGSGAAAPAPAGPVDMDADAPAPAKGGKPAKAVDNSPTPVAGQPTDAAAQAKRLYESEKWWDAAQALYRVSTGETGDDEGNKQIAQFNLAKALYKLKFFQGAYSIFSEIADKPNHLKYNETLLWLAKLATDLPEPADIVERVGKYNEQQVAKFNNKEQEDLFWQLNYLLGRYKYRNGQYPEALELFEKVDRRSKYYVQAQFFGGISQRAAAPEQAGGAGVPAHPRAPSRRATSRSRTRRACATSRTCRWRARSTRRASSSTTTPTRRPSTRRACRAAVKYWNKVDVASEYWLDALFEESWAYFMAGDYSHALGNIHTIESPYFPHVVLPRGRRPQGRHLLRQLPVRRRAHDRREVPRPRTSPSATQLTKKLDKFKKALERRGGVLQVPEGRPRRQGAARPEDRAHRQDVALGPAAAPQPRVRAPPRRGGRGASRRRRAASRTRRSPTS